MADIAYPDTIRWPSSRVWPTGDDLTEEIIANRELAETYGWVVFQMLAGLQLSLSPITVRPCKKSCRFGRYYVAPAGGSGGSPFSPYIAIDGQWVNSWCGDRFDCSCTVVEEVILPGPVGQVEEVIIDGTVVDPTHYRVDNGNHLVREDGEGWPYCQNMNLPAGEEGTFTVTYSQGATPDSLVNYAVGVLANEFYKSIAGEKGCRLSKRVTGVTRQGVQYDFDKAMFEDGVTGVDEVDVIIQRYNPMKLKARPQVASVDSLRGARRTTIPNGQPGYGYGAGGYGQ